MTADYQGREPNPDLDPASLSELLEQVLESCTAWNRTDLVNRLETVRERLARSSTLICVVGEYKQGKSQLINALTGEAVCPVDDDLATSVLTTVAHADMPEARVLRAVDGETRTEAISIERLDRYVTERGAPDERKGIELAEVRVPSTVLERGLTLVDTPGAGGVVETDTEVTVRFLSLADGVIFTTDASQEITATEIAFLGRVREVCPHVIVAVTKTDLYPAWKRIVDIDRSHLDSYVGDVEVMPVSADLLFTDPIGLDPESKDESGIARLLDLVQERVVEKARQRNAELAVHEIRWAAGQLLHSIEAQISLIEDPDDAAGTMGRLNATRKRMTELQEVGARWATLLNDGFSDLRTEVEYRIRTAVRGVLAETDERLEEIDPASDWNPFARQVQESVNSVVAEVFETIDSGTDDINRRIRDLLADEDPYIRDVSGAELDVTKIWDRSERQPDTSTPMRVSGSLAMAVNTLRGASSGMILLGVVGNIAGVAFASPVSVGAAAFFAGKQFLETRRTALKRRRQEARTVVRKYVEEVNLELGNRTRRLIQEAHRMLRDHYTIRIRELSNSTNSTLQAIQENLAREKTKQQEQLKKLEKWSSHLHGQLDAVSAPPGGATN
jgi:predicted GTPase